MPTASSAHTSRWRQEPVPCVSMQARIVCAYTCARITHACTRTRAHACAPAHTHDTRRFQAPRAYSEPSARSAWQQRRRLAGTHLHCGTPVCMPLYHCLQTPLRVPSHRLRGPATTNACVLRRRRRPCPHAQRLVEGARHQEAPVGGERDPRHNVPVPPQDRPSCIRVAARLCQRRLAYVDHVVAARGRHQARVPRDRNVPHGAGVLGQGHGAPWRQAVADLCALHRPSGPRPPPAARQPGAQARSARIRRGDCRNAGRRADTSAPGARASAARTRLPADIAGRGGHGASERAHGACAKPRAPRTQRRMLFSRRAYRAPPFPAAPRRAPHTGAPACG